MRYRVKVSWYASSFIDVDANSRIEAREQAREIFKTMGEDELMKCTAFPSSCMDDSAREIGE